MALGWQPALAAGAAALFARAPGARRVRGLGLRPRRSGLGGLRLPRRRACWSAAGGRATSCWPAALLLLALLFKESGALLVGLAAALALVRGPAAAARAAGRRPLALLAYVALRAALFTEGHDAGGVDRPGRGPARWLTWLSILPDVVRLRCWPGAPTPLHPVAAATGWTAPRRARRASRCCCCSSASRWLAAARRAPAAPARGAGAAGHGAAARALDARAAGLPRAGRAAGRAAPLRGRARRRPWRWRAAAAPAGRAGARRATLAAAALLALPLGPRDARALRGLQLRRGLRAHGLAARAATRPTCGTTSASRCSSSYRAGDARRRPAGPGRLRPGAGARSRASCGPRSTASSRWRCWAGRTTRPRTRGACCSTSPTSRACWTTWRTGTWARAGRARRAQLLQRELATGRALPGAEAALSEMRCARCRRRLRHATKPPAPPASGWCRRGDLNPHCIATTRP